ncbi:MAG TPA: hypothetical protein QGH16_08155, partial [Verrucomicrobiota bacterium]|nr:hypothetical protein [Verrucomicrobiota bacterium]
TFEFPNRISPGPRNRFLLYLWHTPLCRIDWLRADGLATVGIGGIHTTTAPTLVVLSAICQRVMKGHL